MTIAPWTDDDPIIEATRADGRTRVKVWRPARTLVVVGTGGDEAREVHMDACLADSVAVERRRGGGCSVVLDPGNVVISVAARSPGLGNIGATFEKLTGWTVRGLREAGVDGVKVKGVSDLVLGTRKVGGSCIHRSRDLVYFSTTVLVTPDVQRMKRYLPHPPREPAYRGGRDHARFMGSVREAAPEMDAELLSIRLGEILGPGTVPTL